MNPIPGRTKISAVNAFKVHHPSISPFPNSQIASPPRSLNGIQVLSPSSGHKVLPNVLDALVLREEVRKGGLYGIGNGIYDFFISRCHFQL